MATDDQTSGGMADAMSEQEQAPMDLEALTALATASLEATAAPRACANAATKGPWRWWTSNSLRCLRSEPPKAGGAWVAEAYRAHDGVPDIAIREEDMAHIEHGRTDVPDLCDRVDALAQGVLDLAADNQAMVEENARLLRRLQHRATPTFGPFEQVEEGGVKLSVRDAAGGGEFLFAAMAGLLEGMGGGKRADNYIALTGSHPVIGGIVVTVQRVGRVTPHEARLAAEQALGRAVARLREHGIPWEEPTTFAPDPPADLPETEGPPSRPPWCRIMVAEQPNQLWCQRCGAQQTMPEEGTATVFNALLDGFAKEHAHCEEGDAARLGRTTP